MVSGMRIGITTVVVLWLVGCASVEPPYKPTTAGIVGSGDADPALQVTLEALTPSVEIGEPIVLRVTIRNISQQRVWLPGQPTVLITWIYPSGLNDSFFKDFQDEISLEPHQIICLNPGQQISQRVEVRTYYFDRPGIVEFRALLHVGHNINPATLQTWTGRLRSNAYGVIVTRPPRTNREHTAAGPFPVWPRP